jgi:D-3-phosphoglycerate dehydrogenase
MTLRPKVLNIDCAYIEYPGYEYEQRRIQTAGGELVLSKAPTEDAIVEAGRQANIVLVEYPITPITARVTANLPQCWAIVKYGVGLDNVDIGAATKHGIVVCNAADYCLEEVSDHTVGLMLAALRRIVVLDANIRAGGWHDFTIRRELRRVSSLTLGLVGLGRIGSAVARKMSGFRMRILATDPYIPPPDPSLGVEMVDLDRLLQESDVISLHTPLTDETRGMMGERAFRIMKPSALLVNTSRGPVVDEEALVRALQEGRIAGAALDVMTEEPLAPSSPLREMDNVVLTPHYAARSEESLRDLRTCMADSVEALLRGYWPPFPANPTVRPRIALKPWKEFRRTSEAV